MNLKTDPNSILFSEEKIGEWLFKKFKKLKYVSCDSLFLKLILLADNKLQGEEKIPTRADFIEKNRK